MEVTQFYLVLGAVLFTLGTLGVLIRRNTIVIFMCIELMLNSVNLTMVALSRQFGEVSGQVFVFFVMAVAAAEAAVGLAIIMTAFRNYHSVRTTDVHDLAG
ncbi:MAG: NADH-quinone oxidoreductase subunit NuoK [Bdellovibrionales bacterium]|nr:NADH-quinone oxidoreductase subunit NuoK [Bdellovibrionales bacterium]